MNILPFKVCTVKSNIPSQLGDHILGVVLHLLWSQDCQEDFEAGDWSFRRTWKITMKRIIKQ